jgi:uncharacterized protein (TIGR02231 family)
MNKLLSPVLLWLVTAGASALAVTADQKVTAVTVYPDRALVTRSGEVKLDPGVQSVVFENLPANLEEDSVRARASSEGKLKILGVEVRRDYHEVTPGPASRQLQDDLAKLDDQIRTLTDEQSDLQRRNQFLDQIRDKVTAQASASDGKDAPATVQNITGLFQLYGTEIGKITTRQREIEFALRDLNRQKSDKSNQLSLLQQPAQPNTRSAVVTVDAADGGSAHLDVTYLISGAGWQPQYDAYADPDTQKVELTYYGVIRQTTGEDWNDVALTLSSARPSTAARLPDLAAWTVDLGGQSYNAVNFNVDLERAQQSAQSLQTRKSLMANATADLKDEADAAQAVAATSPAPVSDATLATAEVRSLGPAATFSVPARTTIPSDNQPHRSAISVQSLQGEWTYEATPKLVPSAFLKTKVTNTSGGPLLGGEINLFLGNDYIGKSSIGLVAANATFDLFLGADENLKVTRTEGVKKEEAGGILTRMKLYKRSFTIELENFKSTAATLKVRDQLPVSKNGQVTVAVNQAEPAFQTRDNDTGEVTWEFKLKPNEKKKVTVAYEIDVPYAQAVAGL